MSLEDRTGLTGIVVAELFDGTTGQLKARHKGKNLVTANGDQLLANVFIGGSLSAQGMKLGTGSTAPSKTGAGATLVTYLTGSNVTPSPTNTAVAGVVTVKCTWTTGVATTASPITEVVIHSNTSANAAPTEANTIARALITGISAKTASDVLVVTWTITILGA